METDGDEFELDDEADDEHDAVDFVADFFIDDLSFLRPFSMGVEAGCLSETLSSDEAAAVRFCALRSSSQLIKSIESKKPEQ
jgi:hypothetical protein